MAKFAAKNKMVWSYHISPKKLKEDKIKGEQNNERL